ncbi:MAG: hypothetical protein U1E39_10310 [Planctomycetota bacterium]
MNPETSREPSTAPADASKPSASDLEARLEKVALEAASDLAAVPFANVEERRRAVYDKVASMLHEGICTADEYYSDAAEIVGKLVCKLIPERGAADKRASAARTPKRQRATKPAKASGADADGDSAKGDDPPSGDVPPVGDDGPRSAAPRLDVEALVAAAVERAVVPLVDENRRLRERLDALEAAAAAARPPDGRILRARSHSPDFASVRWDGQTFAFTPLQAAVVAVLWRAWEAGTPALRAESIGERAGSAADRFRLDLLFRGHAALGTLIVRAGKGLWSIGEDPAAAGAVPQKHRCGTVAAPRGVEGRCA